MRIKNKTFRRIISLVVLIVMFLTAYVVLDYVLRPVTHADYFNRDIREIEEKGQSVDLVFVGASRVFRSYVPKVFEETLDMDCVINAGSSAQPLNATYYQLKDLIERVSPKRIMIGVTWDGLCNTPSMQGGLIVYDRLSFRRKLECAIECLGEENFLYAFGPYRFRNNISNIESIYKEKVELRRNDYAVDTEANVYYADKGFVYFRKAHEKGTIPMAGTKIWNPEKIKPENLAWLDACVELCKEKGIEVSLVTGPFSLAKVYFVNDYQMAFDWFTQYAGQKGISYYNLNYLKNREEYLSDEVMIDYGHVNGEGAYIVSEIFAEILAKERAGSDISDYFYKSLDELKKDVHRVVSVRAKLKQDENSDNLIHIKCESLQNDDIKPYYMIEISKDGGETYSIWVDWTQNNEMDIELEKGKKNKIKVSAKSNLIGDTEAYQIYDYK